MEKIIAPLLFVLSPYVLSQITTVKNSTWCYTFLIDLRENLKVHFFQADLSSPYKALFEGHICGSDVPQILCLHYPWIVADWIDFKPPFQNKVHSSLGYVFFLQPNIHLIFIYETNKPKICNRKWV